MTKLDVTQPVVVLWSGDSTSDVFWDFVDAEDRLGFFVATLSSGTSIFPTDAKRQFVKCATGDPEVQTE